MLEYNDHSKMIAVSLVNPAAFTNPLHESQWNVSQSTDPHTAESEAMGQ